MLYLKNRKCCEGYIWDLNKGICEKCKPGYIGPNCSIKCPHPAYGDTCQEICNCSEDECDSVTGCKPMSSVKFEPSVVGEYTTQETYPSSGFYNATVFRYQVSTSAPNKSEYTTRESWSKSVSGDLKGTLVILIKLFGVVDIFLICVYELIFMHDHLKERKATQNREFVERNNYIYENVEIVFS
ncbi:uncharacterized protein LOC111099618 [Crassostrea virginica]